VSTTAKTTGARKGARSAWVVKCPDFTTKPRADRDGAEREMAEIVRAGNCRQDHEVVEVAR